MTFGITTTANGRSVGDDVQATVIRSGNPFSFIILAASQSHRDAFKKIAIYTPISAPPVIASHQQP